MWAFLGICKLASDVDDFYLRSDMAYANLFIRYKGEKEVGKGINGYYPYSANQVFTLDKKGRLYFSGDDSCFLTCLWVWGRDIKSGARKYSAKPEKIAKLAWWYSKKSK